MRPTPLALLAALVAAAPAGAVETSTSSNWAGYAVKRAGVTFDRVSGAWTVPEVDCSAGTTEWSAVWVGLGGYADDAPALEQVGTEADCDSSGREHYSSWYELVPDVSHAARLAVSPGDRVSASVTVTGRRVRLRLSNRTTGKAFEKRLTARVIDLTSAEWIVEAPSACAGDTDADCRVMPLADFGSTRITEAKARSRGGVTGSISDRGWDAVQIDLASGGPGGRFGRRGPSGGGADTGALNASGRAFTVRYSP